MVINFRVFLFNYFSSSVVHFKAPVPYHSTATAHILTAMILFLPWSFELWISLRRLLYNSFLSCCFISSSLTLLNLESWGICIHLFPLHLLFSCWVAKSFTSNHLSSLQNQHPALLKTKLHSKSWLIVCTVFTRDSNWLSLFPSSFKSSINNWWFIIVFPMM